MKQGSNGWTNTQTVRNGDKDFECGTTVGKSSRMTHDPWYNLAVERQRRDNHQAGAWWRLDHDYQKDLPLRSTFLTLFWRLQSSNLYSELFVTRTRWIRSVKPAKGRWVSISVADMNPTFTAQEFCFQTITTPGYRKTVYLINLRESTEINRNEGD